MKANSENGFSIVELMIAAALTVGLLGAIFSIVNRNQQVFTTETGVVDMNQNLRTVVDLLTRDIQSAATGLPVPSLMGAGSLAGIFYVDGASTNPDAIMVVNGDPIAPTAEVKQQVTANSQFLLFPPPDVKSTNDGQSFTYADLLNNNAAKSIYVTTDSDTFKRTYLVYDDDNCQIFKLTANGVMTTDAASNQVIQLQYGSVQNPAGTFGTLMGVAVDGNAAPNFVSNKAAVAVLGGTIAYKLDSSTHELMRTEDLKNWYSVARGVLDFQIQYRVIAKNGGTIEEKVVNKPGVDKFDSNATTARRGIRSVIFTIRAETPDLDPADKAYRQTVQKFEVTPRNLNFSNNNNLSSN
jgi:Tfp pilus assembly protein PilW